MVLEILPDLPYPTLDGIQTLLTRLEVENPEAKNIQPTDVVNISILEKLEQDGFTNQIQAKSSN